MVCQNAREKRSLGRVGEMQASVSRWAVLGSGRARRARRGTLTSQHAGCCACPPRRHRPTPYHSLIGLPYTTSSAL